MIRRSHEDYMRMAISLAYEGKQAIGGAPFGAVVVLNDDVISAAYNQVNIQNNCLLHAETYAIQQACKRLRSKDLSQCILYTSCEPCMMCLGASYWAGFKKIYFGASAGDAKKAGYQYANMYYNSTEEKRREEFNLHQLLRDEALQVWGND
ncbi:nucleoside deaminase [Gangjinia marincola]|uniref:Nucleoside deaminase n=1 Tax=Gangjinia marincola TaxID=578463 RepID=A0ABP3XTK1_9FLAO